MALFRAIFRLLCLCIALLNEVPKLVRLMVGPRASLAAEILFLRKQLAFYQERKITPRRFDDPARLSMLLLWGQLLVDTCRALTLSHIDGFAHTAESSE
jgi:hypothetical protein